MKEIQYKDFSLKTHKKNWLIKRPNVCHFELTFGCWLHCRHCYSDCYNKPGLLKKELSTKQVKLILDKARHSGVIWLCLTGGDPLARADFLDIYSYAKKKGFLVTLFTNACAMNGKIAAYLKKSPPFVIEMTLNAADEDLYEQISQVKGSYIKAIEGIGRMLKAGLSLKIKTQITKDNFSHRHRIKKFIEGLGLKFNPSFQLHARLNSDPIPCSLRISVDEALSLSGRRQLTGDTCESSPQTKRNTGLGVSFANSKLQTPNSQTDLFRCAITGGDGVIIDPYGNTFPCILIRNPRFNLLRHDIEDARQELLSSARGRTFTTDSKCNGCRLRDTCRWCPGRALVETGDIEKPIDYYCQLSEKLELH